MLEAQDLRRSFRGIPAIESVSFKVAPGEIVASPNADAGKSTIVKINTGILLANVILPTLVGVLVQLAQHKITRGIEKEHLAVMQLCHA
jgi:ABC-type branched-subunit amino acid transport system ATPase component